MAKQYQFDPQDHQKTLKPLASDLINSRLSLTPQVYRELVKKYPKSSGGHFSKAEVLAGVRAWFPKAPSNVFDFLRLKPIRTASGVTPVTVLTKPFPCPGKCIFCPNDVRMPKSYLYNEPGAQRAGKLAFDPYMQTYTRLEAFQAIGHPVSKVELIVLGGTWSFYPEAYQIWFVARCFEALNDFSKGVDKRHQHPGSVDVSGVSSPKRTAQSYNESVSKLYLDTELNKRKLGKEESSWQELESLHRENETAAVKCVGLVLETRPDFANKPAEVVRLRRLGATKIQIGIQSLQDEALSLNQRGHGVKETREAIGLLRRAGFKIHAHWMPNLYGSSVERDKQDYRDLFEQRFYKPDELKVYPCSLIDDTELMALYEQGKFKPYTYQQLLDVLTFCLTHTPRYTRLTRVVRDIPSTDIVEGNKLTNFRQYAQKQVEADDGTMLDIRAREIRHQKVDPDQLRLKITSYPTSVSEEVFLEYVTLNDQIAGFLRLSLPQKPSFIEELAGSAIIREIHVYGQAIDLGKTKQGKAQHQGLGKKLIKEAIKRASQAGYSKLAVISAIGTREYYRQRGFTDGQLYQFKTL